VICFRKVKKFKISNGRKRMANDLTHAKIMQALDWAYEKAVNGVAGLDSAEEMTN